VEDGRKIKTPETIISSSFPFDIHSVLTSSVTAGVGVKLLEDDELSLELLLALLDTDSTLVLCWEEAGLAGMLFWTTAKGGIGDTHTVPKAMNTLIFYTDNRV
jgi:hypothetical protein